MPLQATSGAASYDGYGGGVPFEPIYIEQIFATHLYTGNGSSQTITNGIDLSGKGGLVWVQNRSTASIAALVDTARGAGYNLASSETSAQALSSTASVQSFLSNGFTVGTGNVTRVNGSSSIYVSWTFRKQPKFFDVVTYTGTGSAQNIAHNLGSVPGCIIVKAYSGGLAGSQNWPVYHRSLLNTETLFLNATDAKASVPGYWNSTTPTSTQFTVGTANAVNQSGATYVAYLFAHDAGGFGLTGSDNVISCGSFTTNGSGIIPTVNLGYEPQWILAKPSSGTGNWFIMDNMRGWYNQQADQGNALFPNTSGAEAVGYNAMIPTATGFTGPNVNFGAGVTYIYIAIRRGPMKTPTSGTSVFTTSVYSGDDADPKYLNLNSVTQDLMIFSRRNNAENHNVYDRLRGNAYVSTNLTDAESAGSSALGVTNFTSLVSGTLSATIRGASSYNTSGDSYCWWNFRRAPGFFDVVCYTGNGTSGRTVTHNLAAAPELMIARQRTGGDWYVYTSGIGATKFLVLNATDAAVTDSSLWNNTAPTSSVFTLGDATGVNRSATNFIAYLFATCAGVSKVGSYTGTGTTKQIDCGFTGGARFVLIKRTDSTGNWYVWDSARGIVSGNDPYLLLNSSAAEVTNTDYVDTYSAGFEISSTAPAAINANGGTFIFLAIA